MKKFAENAFETIGLGAGVLLNTFTSIEAIANEHIIGATRGGSTISVPATMRSYNIDGVRENTMGNQVIDDWRPTFAFTLLTMDKEKTQMALGVADIDEEGKVIPRHKIKDEDYKDYYWVGERSDGATIVMFLGNALSTGGLSWRTTHNGEVESSITLTAHYTRADQDKVPFYMQEIVKAE